MYVVGAANSAGQAALNLASSPAGWCCSCAAPGSRTRCRSTSSSGSAAADNVEVRLRTEVVAAHGDDHLEALTLADRDTGAEDEVATNWLFVFIGALPRTDWLGDDVVRDDKGFVITGPDLQLPEHAGRLAAAPAPRSPWRRACPGCSRPATCGSTR